MSTRLMKGMAFGRVAAALALLAVSLGAHATLGGNGASVNADQAALHATLKATVGNSYTDYALTLPDGIVVHEFVNPAGRVFEVTWSGMGHRPDMSQILGSYASRFARSTGKGRPVDRHSHRVESDLQIHSVVRNRYFSGTAHLPGALPESMSTPLSVPVEAR